MLIEFSVGNYRSFKEVVTFSMVAAKISSRDKELDKNNVFKVNDRLSLLKSAAIYGANGSGKSNLIEAIRFMRSFVRDSSKDTQAGESIDIEEFRLSEETVGQPSFFQMIFFLNERRYRYGFEVDKKRVVSEWLFHVPKKIETKLFVREGDDISISTTFKEGKGLQDKTRSNALFLSVAAQFNGPIAQEVLKWFRMLRVYFGGLRDMRDYDYTISLLENTKYRDIVLTLLKKLDFDFQVATEKIPLKLPTITSEGTPEKFKSVASKLTEIFRELETIRPNAIETIVKTFRPRYNSEGHPIALEEFNIDRHESAGTQKVFKLVGSLVDVLTHGKILIMDELDVRLHPLITCAIIELFNSNEINPNNAQLIFTTHDTNLLRNDFFRRDQIWFVEKDRCSASHLYSLAEYKVRNDASFRNDYIQGRYGAIPYIGDLRHLLDNAKE